MGIFSVIVDIIIVYFSIVIMLTGALIDSQCALPSSLYPTKLVELKRYFEATYDDYIYAESTPFFVGVVWLELFFLCPLCLANIVGIVRRKTWVATGVLMAGVCTGTITAAIYGELLNAGRATEKLVQVFLPFIGFSILATLRGLFARHGTSTNSASNASSARKKNA